MTKDNTDAIRTRANREIQHRKTPKTINKIRIKCTPRFKGPHIWDNASTQLIGYVSKQKYSIGNN